MAREWWENRVNVIELVRWLVDRGEIRDTASAAVDVFEKPWKWTAEFNVMAAENWREANAA